MTLDQVAAFLDQAKAAGGIGRVKLLGGCPLKHSDFPGVYSLFLAAVEVGTVELVKIETSGAIPVPSGLTPHPRIRFGGRRPKKKVHLPYLWSPSDLGLAIHAPCSHPWRCGFSIDARGWLPCSPAIMVDRLFYGGSHYRERLPADGRVWGIDALCKHCAYAAAPEWRAAHATPIAQFTREMRMPTRSWAEALRRAGVVAADDTYEPGQNCSARVL